MDHPQRKRDLQQEIKLNSDTNVMKILKSYDFDQLKEIFDHFFGPKSYFLSSKITVRVENVAKNLLQAEL